MGDHKIIQRCDWLTPVKRVDHNNPAHFKDLSRSLWVTPSPRNGNLRSHRHAKAIQSVRHACFEGGGGYRARPQPLNLRDRLVGSHTVFAALSREHIRSLRFRELRLVWMSGCNCATSASLRHVAADSPLGDSTLSSFSVMMALC